MSKTANGLEKLRNAAEAGRDRLDKDGKLDLSYLTELVTPILKEIIPEMLDEIEVRHRFDKTEDDKKILVVHYTSIGALLSMLQTAMKNKQSKSKSSQGASLRLYDSIHFNDPDEGNYLYRQLKLTHGYDWLHEQKKSHAYIASFIKPNAQVDISDKLEFWVAYGKEGEGCSLTLPVPGSRLRKVLYGAGEVRKTGQTLEPLLESLLPLIGLPCPRGGEEVRTKLLETVGVSLEPVRYLYKSEAYRYEDECRFVIPEPRTVQNHIRFEEDRQSDDPGGMRHYYEDDALDVEKLFVSGSSITLGPCVRNSYNVAYYLERSLRLARLEGPKIKVSRISYRKVQ